jgi:hypothetical protein
MFFITFNKKTVVYFLFLKVSWLFYAFMTVEIIVKVA